MAGKLTKTRVEIRNDILTSIRNGARKQGRDADISTGTDTYLRGDAVAGQIAQVYYNVDYAVAAAMPDTATGKDLDAVVSRYGLGRRSAASSAGKILLVADSSTLVPIGTQLNAPNGIKFKTTFGGTFAPGTEIPIASIDLGVRANLPVGTILQWVARPAFTPANATLSQAATGAVDLEDDATLRARLYSRLGNPPGAANWEWIAELAEQIDPSVQKALVYGAANGPASVHVAICAYASGASKSRALDDIRMNSIVIPGIVTQMPKGIECVVTTVEDLPVDVAFNISIPLPSSSSISGTAGGWLDAQPFPAVDNSTRFFTAVSDVTNDAEITIDSLPGVAPVAGSTRIMWVDKSGPDWTVVQATITGFTGAGPYVVTLDTPFVGVAEDDWIFPACEHAQDYLDAILVEFAQMGPGEKTNVVTLVSRAAREPKPTRTFPAVVDTSLLKALNASEEVQTSSFYYRGTSTPAVQATSTKITPPIPSLITDPPKICIPRMIGFYNAIDE